MPKGKTNQSLARGALQVAAGPLWSEKALSYKRLAGAPSSRAASLSAFLLQTPTESLLFAQLCVSAVCTKRGKVSCYPQNAWWERQT